MKTSLKLQIGLIIVLIVVALIILNATKNSRPSLSSDSPQETQTSESHDSQKGDMKYDSRIFSELRGAMLEVQEKDDIRAMFESELASLTDRRKFIESMKESFQADLKANDLESLSESIFLMNEIHTHATAELIEDFFVHLSKEPQPDSETLDATRLFMLRTLMENSDSVDVDRALALANKSCAQKDDCQYEKDLIESLR